MPNIHECGRISGFAATNLVHVNIVFAALLIYSTSVSAKTDLWPYIPTNIPPSFHLISLSLCFVLHLFMMLNYIK